MTNDVGKIIDYRESDAEFWRTELEDFVPRRIFDAHTHLWNGAFLRPGASEIGDWHERETSFSDLRAISATLLPGRETDFMAFPTPVAGGRRPELNAWAAGEVSADPKSFAAALVEPDSSPEELETLLKRHRNVVALKPYYLLTPVRNPGISDYLPERLLPLADESRLGVVLHLQAGPLPVLAELKRLSAKYPNVQWILAHCATPPFDPSGLEACAKELREIPTVWFDMAVRYDLHTLALLLKSQDRSRIMFGSDDALVLGGCRKTSAHPGAPTTFKLYWQLLALKRACLLLDSGDDEIRAIFHGNATRLLDGARR